MNKLKQRLCDLSKGIVSLGDTGKIHELGCILMVCVDKLAPSWQKYLICSWWLWCKYSPCGLFQTTHVEPSAHKILGNWTVWFVRQYEPATACQRESWLCVPLPSSVISDILLVAWNQWWNSANATDPGLFPWRAIVKTLTSTLL